MFFLSSGCINKLLNKKQSLFDRASGTSHTSAKSSIRLNMLNDLSIVKCMEVLECSNDDLYTMVIYDGVVSHRVYFRMNECNHNLEQLDDHQLDAGCVLILIEYTLLKVRDLFEHILPEDELEYDLDEEAIKLNSFRVIGHDYADHNRKDAAKEDLEEEIRLSQKKLELVTLHDEKEKHLDKEHSVDILPRHVIANVKVDLSNSAWSLKCQLVERTLKLSFVHRDTHRDGHKMRILLYDGHKYIECIAFDDLISKLESLELDRIYLIENANVNMSKLAYKAWPNQTNNVVEYDLVVKRETNFLLLPAGTLNQRKDLLVKDVPTTSKQADIETRSAAYESSSPYPTPDVSNQAQVEVKEPNVNFRMADVKTNDLKSISEIHKMPSNEFVNMIGIVHKIFELKEVSDSYGHPLNLLNIEMIDKSKYPIKVTLWGREAAAFRHKIGDCLVFNKIKTNLYKNKMSLSKTKECTMTNVSSFIENKKVLELNQWYSEYCLLKKSKNDNQKRALPEDEESESVKKLKN